jgi:hypothetical protein
LLSATCLIVLSCFHAFSLKFPFLFDHLLYFSKPNCSIFRLLSRTRTDRYPSEKVKSKPHKKFHRVQGRMGEWEIKWRWSSILGTGIHSVNWSLTVLSLKSIRSADLLANLWTGKVMILRDFGKNHDTPFLKYIGFRDDAVIFQSHAMSLRTIQNHKVLI